MIIKEFLKKYKIYIFIISILLLLILGFVLFLSRANIISKFVNLNEINSDNSEVLGGAINEISKEGDKTARDDCEVFVDVSGAVKKPAVYCLKEGSLVIDAITKANGFDRDKYSEVFVRSNINLAKKLLDNEKIYIPFKQDVLCNELSIVRVPKTEIIKDSTGGGGNSNQACISINQATLDQLDTLEGVGPALAQKIVDSRPYKSVNDLNNVSGIGESLFEKIKGKVCL